MGERIRCLCPSIKALFTRHPFLMPKDLYTRLPFIPYKSVIYMTAVFHAKFSYTLLPGLQYEMDTCIYNAAILNNRIKTTLQFLGKRNATKHSKMTSIAIICMTSVSAIVIERNVNKQTDEKRFYNEMHCRSGDIRR